MSSPYRSAGSQLTRRVLVGLVMAWMAAPPAAGAADAVTMVATIDGRPASEATERRPIRLNPKRPATIDLRVTNAGSAAVEVATVRLQGQVMALTFFAYDTSVGMTVRPGATETRTFVIDLVGLGGQATGLIQGSVALLDPERHALTSEPMVVDVRGSMRSVYGIFGLVLASLTVLGLAGALVALATHQLPDNRWRRGLRFLTPGLGFGLVVVFTLSALRVFVPRPGRWAPILLVSGAVLFALGYLTPSPDDDDDHDEAEDEDGADAAYDAAGVTPPATSGRQHAPPGGGGAT